MNNAYQEIKVPYKGRVIIASNKIEGWWMTECQTLFGESIQEIVMDIDRELQAEVRNALKVEPSANKFEEGKTYRMTFIGDSDLIVPVTIIKRTAKTVRISIGNANEVKTCYPRTYDGVEYIYPHGTYSMAPSVYSNKLY